MFADLRKPLPATIMAAYILAITCFPASAGMIPSSLSSPGQSFVTRSEEIGRIQRILENKILAGKLAAYGFTPSEIQSKISHMTDEQVHLLAQASDRLPSGGQVGVVLAILLFIFVDYILIVKLMEPSGTSDSKTEK